MEDLTKYTVRPSQTLKEAISVIQGSSTRCVIIVNAQGKVLGVFSEGDVLRAILDGADPYAQLSHLMRPSFKYLSERDVHKAYDLFCQHGITLVPVVDEEFHLKSVITIFDILKQCRYVDEPGA